MPPRSRPLLTALLLLLVASGCHRGQAHPGHLMRAFYFWRTSFSLTPPEQAALTNLHVSRLYVRAFDVDLGADGQTPEPVAPLGVSPGTHAPPGVEVVPVVFLRERVFHAQTQRLAQHVWDEVQTVSRSLSTTPRELQLDCDWTPSTKDAYFGFLRELAALARPSGVTLSATIRLHQVKYRERTGVPPVERGMLMFYNMGRIGPGPEDHAIFDPHAARLYVKRLADYPLPLDVGLPIWAWVVRVRAGQVQDLLQSVDPEALGKSDALTGIGPHRWRATRDTFLHGTFVRKDDELQVDQVDSAQALSAAKLVAAHLGPSPLRSVSLFQLSEPDLARHSPQDLERLFAVLQ